MSFCISLRNFIQIGPPSAENNDVMSIFKMADLRHLGFYGSNNGFFEKPMYDFLYRSSIETIALKCLVFEKIACFAFCRHSTDRQTNRQTNRWTAPMDQAAIASGGLITNELIEHLVQKHFGCYMTKHT